MKVNGEPSSAKLHREVLADRKARQPQWYSEGQAAYANPTVRRLFKTSDATSARRLLLEGSAEWTRLLPPQAPTLTDVSYHEAGHYAASEALGLVASRAKVRGTPFGQHGWSGSAWSDHSLNDRELTKPTADDVWREVVTTFAGPAAEHAFAGGNALNSHGEIMIPGLGACSLAKLRGTTLRAELRRLIEDTARVLHGYRTEIATIADCLTRKHEISRWRPRAVAKALEAIRARPPISLSEPTAAQVDELIGLVNSVPIDLPALVRSIAK